MPMRWKILALLVIVRIGLGFQFQTLASISDQLITRFNVDYTSVGTLIGLFMLSGLFLALPVGWIGRYASDRILSSLGMALLACGGFIAALADTTFQIGVGRIICGAGFVIATIYLAKMVTDWFAGQEIATAMSLLVMTWPLGIAAGQIIHTWLAHNANWSTPFLLASLFCTVGAVALLAWYRPPANTQTTQHTKQTHFGIGLSRKELILLVVASVSWALFNAGYVVFLSFAPSWLAENGYSSLQAAAVVSSASWVMMFSIVAGGAIADRTGKPDAVLYFCMLVAVLSLMALFHSKYALPAALLFGLIGAAPAGIIMALASEAIEPANRAIGMGVFFSLYFLLVAPAPVIAGWLVDRTGSAWHAVVFAAVLFAATAVSYRGFRTTSRMVNSSSA